MYNNRYMRCYCCEKASTLHEYSIPVHGNNTIECFSMMSSSIHLIVRQKSMPSPPCFLNHRSRRSQGRITVSYVTFDI